MQYRMLGRTGLTVSVMGVGGGGPSKLGSRTTGPDASVALLQDALAAGVNFIDTAQSYGTEAIVGQAIKSVARDRVVVATKGHVSLKTRAAEFESRIEGSLRELDTDYIDVFNLHALRIQAYDHAVNEIVPLLQKLQAQGKIRFFGVTEQFAPDPQHVMLQRAVQDDCWDVMMVGFNLLNQSARDRVFAATMAKGIGTLVMFAVRIALSRSEALKKTIAFLIENGQVDPDEIDHDDPLNFLLREGGARSVPEAAYRFCAHEPGADVILSGTGNPDHLRANLEAFALPPLPPQTVEKLRHIFRHVDSVSASEI